MVWPVSAAANDRCTGVRTGMLVMTANEQWQPPDGAKNTDDRGGYP